MMYLLSRSVYVAVLALNSYSLFAGQQVGNGGDAVLCIQTPQKLFDEYYSLDYLVEFSSSDPIVEVQSLDGSLNRLENIFREKLPELLPRFEDYRRSIFNEYNLTLSRIWKKDEYGLLDLKDENIVTILPENCRDGERVKIVQAIVREFGDEDPIVYRYVPKVIDSLSQTNPAQLSFLIVHELLWDWSRNVKDNRKLNYLLHSKRFDAMSRDEVANAFYRLGVTTPLIPIEFGGVFSGKYVSHEFKGRCQFPSLSRKDSVWSSSLDRERGLKILHEECRWMGGSIDEDNIFDNERSNFAGGLRPEDCLNGNVDRPICKVGIEGIGRRAKMPVSKNFYVVKMSFFEALKTAKADCEEYFSSQGFQEYFCETFSFDMTR